MQRKFINLTISIIVISLTACRTLQSEQKYYLKHFEAITKKYDWKLGKITTDPTPHNYKLPTRKQTKSFLAFAEHNMALWPDSISITSSQIQKTDTIAKDQIRISFGAGTIDSFYIKPAKIEYIKKHHLETQHKHFLYKTEKQNGKF